MTKKTDEKGTKDDDKDLKKEELDNEPDEDEDEDEDEEDEESDEDEDEEDEDEEDVEDDHKAASAKAPPGKTPEPPRRPRHEEYLEGDAEHAQAEDPSWWAPHAVLGVLVLLGVLGFLGVFNKAVGFVSGKVGGGSETTTTTTSTSTPTSRTPTAPPPEMPGQPAQPREMFGAKHLLVMYKGSRRAPPNIERSKDEAKARATEAQKKAKGGAKFEDLVKEYSDEPGAADRGGDLGKFPKGAMVPEFQAGLDKIKVGEISDVVETAFGFHVILRTQ